MLHSYLKGAKLRSWLSRPDCPTAIHECKTLLDQAYRYPDSNPYVTHDSLVNSTDLPNAVKAPHELQGLVGLQRVVLRTYVKDKTGIVYSRASTHLGNSLVLFYPKGNHSSNPTPGSIKYIYGEEESFIFAVQRQCLLVPVGFGANSDPFAIYPHFPARLYSSALQETLECVKFSWVVGHYVQWAVSREHVVILNLSQVRNFLRLPFNPADLLTGLIYTIQLRHVSHSSL